MADNSAENSTRDAHAQQAAYWNGPGADMWVTRQARMDAALAPVTRALLAHAAAAQGERVLDIGCGTGETVLALADAVGPGGHVTGIDISEPMLGLARTRATGHENITLALADAASWQPPQPVDLLVSRFGVMFFGDPVAAFRNLRACLAPAGRLRFACWRPAADNDWVRIPRQALAPHLPPAPPADPGLPGQFAFGDAGRVADILTQAGFTAPTFTKCDFPMPIGRDLDDAVTRTSEFGATGRMFDEATPAAQAIARDVLRATLAPYATSPGPVRLPGAVWLVAAS